MNYRLDKYENRLSVLGFGCMRFPSKMGIIDMKETEREILYAVENGINYFDTAYVYPGSEAALGEILEKNNLRNRVYIATKLPHYLISSREKLESLFQEQLRRLRTDHVDYYLMHMLTDSQTWRRLCDLGLCQWLEEKKESGAIRQVGFSYHGNSGEFCRLCDQYPWDFCQIQYNYMDEYSQAGRKGLSYAYQKGIPVVIMEPLRGGRLVKNLPEKAMKLFQEYPISHTPASWAFRWLWNQKEVTVVLSGMNSMEMLEENLQTASECYVGELGESEQALLRLVLSEINKNTKVGCTGCGYCMPCPKNVDIPGNFVAYNRRFSEGRFSALTEYTMCTALRKNPSSASLCVGCGMCEKHCPQALPIRRHLKEVQRELEGPLYRLARRVGSKFFRF